VYRKPPARSYRRRLDGEQEARLVALTCSAPPEGHKRWTLRLLADRLVALQVVESVSYETARQVLARHSIGQVLQGARVGLGRMGAARDGHGQCLGLWEASGVSSRPHADGWHARSGRNSPHPRSGGKSEGPAPS
jgi:Homeodomain-like domain